MDLFRFVFLCFMCGCCFVSLPAVPVSLLVLCLSFPVFA